MQNKTMEQLGLFNFYPFRMFIWPKDLTNSYHDKYIKQIEIASLQTFQKRLGILSKSRQIIGEESVIYAWDNILLLSIKREHLRCSTSDKRIDLEKLSCASKIVFHHR